MFRVKNGKLTTDKSFEESVIELCEQYPTLYVLVVGSGPAWKIVVNFYAELTLETRKLYPTSNTRWEIEFTNGSIIRFQGISDGKNTMLPDPPIHVVIKYGRMATPIVNNIYRSVRVYEHTDNKVHKGLFPLVNDDSYIFWGDEFDYEAKYTEEKTAKVTGITFSTRIDTDMSKYPKAKQLQEEEQQALKDFENELKESQIQYKKK